jgi:hypothetical protein
MTYIIAYVMLVALLLIFWKAFKHPSDDREG